jgi:hypothetical protein
MSQAGSRAPAPPRRGPSPLGAAGVYLAGVLMLLQGVLTVLESVATLRRDNVYAHFGVYAYRFNLPAWGWIQLILGVFLIVAAAALFGGAGWARIAGIILAGLHLIANFLFLPYQPQWSVTLIALSAFALWALCRDVRATGDPTHRRTEYEV